MSTHIDFFFWGVVFGDMRNSLLHVVFSTWGIRLSLVEGAACVILGWPTHRSWFAMSSDPSTLIIGACENRSRNAVPQGSLLYLY